MEYLLQLKNYITTFNGSVLTFHCTFQASILSLKPVTTLFSGGEPGRSQPLQAKQVVTPTKPSEFSYQSGYILNMSGRFQDAHQRQVCWKCRRPGHYSRECPLRASTGSSTSRTFKSASARRHDQERMQAFIFRKQFPFGQLQDTEFRQELQDSVPTQKSMPVMQQLLHKISRLEGTVSHMMSVTQVVETPPVPPTPLCYVVSTQTVQPVKCSSNASTQTCDVQLDNKLLNLQSQIDNLEENFKNKSDECQTLIHDKSMAALQNQKNKFKY